MIVVRSNQHRNFVPKIWNKIVAKISVRSIPSDAEIFASNSVAKKKIELVQNLQQFDLSFLKFLTELFDEQFVSKLLLQKFFVKKNLSKS